MANRRMKMGKPKAPKVPSPKAIYKERMKKPEPDNYPARPKGMAKKRLKGVSI